MSTSRLRLLPFAPGLMTLLLLGCSEGLVLSNLVIDVDPEPVRPRDATVATNVEPVVDAGDDQTVNAGEAVVLNGTRTFDGDADHLLFSWSQVSGDPVLLEGSGASIASFNAPTGHAAAVTLTFRLTVIDGTVARTDDVNVTVNP